MATEPVRVANFPLAKSTAATVLIENSVSGPPVPINSLIETYDLKVSEVDFDAKYDNVCGYIDLEARTIVINRSNAPTRKAFTLAHELGHWLLHPVEIAQDPSQTVVFRIPLDRPDPDPLEKEANSFAANLLVPEDFLRRPEYAGMAVSEIAKCFGVSPQVIEYRHKNLTTDSQTLSQT